MALSYQINYLTSYLGSQDDFLKDISNTCVIDVKQITRLFGQVILVSLEDYVPRTICEHLFKCFIVQTLDYYYNKKTFIQTHQFMTLVLVKWSDNVTSTTTVRDPILLT